MTNDEPYRVPETDHRRRQRVVDRYWLTEQGYRALGAEPPEPAPGPETRSA